MGMGQGELLKSLPVLFSVLYKMECAIYGILKESLPAGVIAPSCIPPTYPGRNLWQKSGIKVYKITYNMKNLKQ